MKAVINGAGIAGLGLARLLDERGWRVLLVERTPALLGGGYLIGFSGPGYDVAEHMGLLPRLEKLAYDIDEEVHVDSRGEQTTALAAPQLADAPASRILSLLRGDLELALHESLGAGIELRFGCTVEEIDQSEQDVSVTLSDGSRHTADVLVGADGLHSRVRELVFGPEQEYLRDLGFHTAAYTFHDRQLAERLADRFAMTEAANRLVGLYALRDGHVAVFAVHRPENQTEPEDARAEMRRVYSGLGWLVPEALQHCPDQPELYYDRVAQIEMTEWSRGRVTLAGDACQAVSLLAGAGASLALTGAHLLASELSSGKGVGEALRSYQAQLLPLVREKQATGRRAATTWFLPEPGAAPHEDAPV